MVAVIRISAIISREKNMPLRIYENRNPVHFLQPTEKSPLKADYYTSHRIVKQNLPMKLSWAIFMLKTS